MLLVRNIVLVLSCSQWMCNNVIPQCTSNSFSSWVTSVNLIVLFCGWQGVVMIACKPFIMEVLFMNFTNLVKGDTSSSYMCMCWSSASLRFNRHRHQPLSLPKAFSTTMQAQLNLKLKALQQVLISCWPCKASLARVEVGRQDLPVLLRAL